MKSYKVTIKNKHYFVKAKDSLEAVNKVEELRDDRLSPMTYRKLKEYGYTSEQWKKWTQEQANKIIASRQNKTETKKSTKKAGNATNSKGNSKKPIQSSAENKKIAKLWEMTESEDYEERYKVAGNTSAPPEILEKLSNDELGFIRRDVAENPNTSLETLEKLANDKYMEVREGVARNTRIPLEILKKLANDKESFVRANVARNPNTPVEILEKLSNDKEDDVREPVALNPNTPAEILEKLSKDKEDDVREFVAKNPNTPVEVLEKLANDKGYNVRRYAVKNPNTPVEILKKIANDKDDDFRGYVAQNTNAPSEVLEKLANDKNNDIRENVARNSNTPPEVLRKLANDKSKDVRKYASRNPNTPKDAIKNKSEVKFSVGASNKVSKDIENMLNEPFDENYDGDYFDISDIEKRIKKKYPDHDIAVVGNYGWGKDDEDTYADYQEVADWCNKNGYNYEFVDANRDVKDYEGDHWDIPAGRALVISKKGEKRGKVRRALGDLLGEV